jgi:hypothetical protein
MKMTLAQALRKKNEIIAEIATLQGRINEALVYRKENKTYSDKDFSKMVKALSDSRKRLVTIKTAIDKGNHTCMNGDTVFGLITLRGETKSELDFATQLRCRLSNDHYEYNDKAPKIVRRMSIMEVDALTDKLKNQLREIDDKISNINGRMQVEADV